MDKNGKDVLLSSTETELNYIGQLLITPGENLTTGLISDYPEIEEDMDNYVKEIQSRFESCGDVRRVRDVNVLGSNGHNTPLDPAETYTLASHNYLIKYGGDGLNQFMDNP